MKELQILRDAAKKAVEDVESKVLEDEQEFNKYTDVCLVTIKTSDDVEKKRVLEVVLQDLANYKLCLD
ncbi:hypothetical protein EJD97_000228 [Solanum chilense]|uniref:Uncharacterized protein n=1 Tax=Solanum chilense TaxID=4083 RepID=A0A6N2AQM5_SOLCI|nr:hypothetical protein EJD97_000228 [Solanum chilense]